MKVFLQRPAHGIRVVGLTWHRAERQYDTVNRLTVGFWVGRLELAWWPKWAL